MPQVPGWALSQDFLLHKPQGPQDSELRAPLPVPTLQAPSMGTGRWALPWALWVLLLAPKAGKAEDSACPGVREDHRGLPCWEGEMHTPGSPPGPQSLQSGSLWTPARGQSSGLGQGLWLLPPVCSPRPEILPGRGGGPGQCLPPCPVTLQEPQRALSVCPAQPRMPRHSGSGVGALFRRGALTGPPIAHPCPLSRDEGVGGFSSNAVRVSWELNPYPLPSSPLSHQSLYPPAHLPPTHLPICPLTHLPTCQYAHLPTWSPAHRSCGLDLP